MAKNLYIKGATAHTVRVAQTWNELAPSQVEALLTAFGMGFAVTDLEWHCVSILTELSVSDVAMVVANSGSPSEQEAVAFALLRLTDFLFTVQDGKRTHTLGRTAVVYATLDGLHAPPDGLEGILFEELAALLNYLTVLGKARGDVAATYRRQAVALLYREGKPETASDAARGYDGDRRLPLDVHTLQARALAMQVTQVEVAAVLFYAASCVQAMTRNPRYKGVFRDGGGDDPFGALGLMQRLAKHPNTASIEKTEADAVLAYLGLLEAEAGAVAKDGG